MFPLFHFLSLSILHYSTGQCPSAEWKVRNGQCYLFRMDSVADASTWDEGLSMCKSLSADASLASIHSEDEMRYVFTEMQNSIDPPGIEMNAWIGMYKEGLGSPYIWENGNEVVYTNWAPGEPNDDDGTQNCVRMYGAYNGEWDDYLCGVSVDDGPISHGYVCKVRTAQDFDLPQYQISISGNFTSDTGEDFSPVCTTQYGASMNTRANDMAGVVNDRINSGLMCEGIGLEDFSLEAVSAPFVVDGNRGTTSHYYIAVVGVNTTFGEVDNCAVEVADYVSVHTNWGTDVLPKITDCPAVQFTQETFSKDGNKWACIVVGEDGNEHADPDELADNLSFSFNHLGLFRSTDGTDIPLQCFSEYNTNFFLETVATVEVVNALISNDTFCQGKQLGLTPAVASLTLSGTQQGTSLQSYEMRPGSSFSFVDIHDCAIEVAGFLRVHSNWQSLLSPIEGCPTLTYLWDSFVVGETTWKCAF